MQVILKLNLLLLAVLSMSRGIQWVVPLEALHKRFQANPIKNIAKRKIQTKYIASEKTIVSMGGSFGQHRNGNENEGD